MGLPLSLKPHRVHIIIMENRANGVEPHHEKGLRYMDKKGNYWYHLKKGNRRIKPIKYNEISAVLSKNWIFLFSPSPGVYLPYKFGVKSAEIINQDVLYWFGLQIVESYNIYKAEDRWEKIAPVIMMGGIIIGFLAVAMILRSEVVNPLKEIGLTLERAFGQLRPT